MLPEEIKPERFEEPNQEDWKEYRNRLALPNERAILEFYRQVVFDHYRHFNEKFPDFYIADHSFEMRRMTVTDLKLNVRFFGNHELGPFWEGQFESFSQTNFDYIIFQEMKKNLTPPFPPILLDPSALKPKEDRDYGRPIHLIEGTHRSSYLIQMAELGIIPWDSEHDFVYVSPKT